MKSIKMKLKYEIYSKNGLRRRVGKLCFYYLNTHHISYDVILYTKPDALYNKAYSCKLYDVYLFSV